MPARRQDIWQECVSPSTTTSEYVNLRRKGVCILQVILTNDHKDLFVYRCTPHGTTGVTHAELLMGRKLRQHLDLLHPDLTRGVEIKQEVRRKNCNGKDRTFQEKDKVFVRNYVSSQKRIKGQIVRKLGTQTYLVKLKIVKVIKRHLNQIKYRIPYRRQPD